MRKTIPDTDLGKFLFYMNEFFTFLEKIFPEDTDLQSYHGKFLEFKKYNAQLVAEIFTKTLLPMEKQILEQDEQFFLNEFKIESIQSNLPIALGEYEEALYNKIRALWLDTLDQTAKETVWKYFAILLGFGKKTMGLM